SERPEARPDADAGSACRRVGRRTKPRLRGRPQPRGALGVAKTPSRRRGAAPAGPPHRAVPRSTARHGARPTPRATRYAAIYLPAVPGRRGQAFDEGRDAMTRLGRLSVLTLLAVTAAGPAQQPDRNTNEKFAGVVLQVSSLIADNHVRPVEPELLVR